MTTPRTVVDENLPVTRIVVGGDLATERVVVEVEDQPGIVVSNTGEDITVSIYTSSAGVNSVNGFQGDVTLTTTNITEGSNLYYTEVRVNSAFDARFPGAFDTRLATKTTTDLAEGTNLYYTNARVDAYVRSGDLDSVRLDITPENTTAPVVGEIKYNSAYGVPYIGLLNDGTTNLGIDVVAYVTNAESTTISKGQVVYLYGAQGDRASVKLAYNTGDSTSSKTFGIAKQDIAAGQAGYVVTQGIVSNLNLGAYQPGDILWLGSTPGSFTVTKPTSPNHLVFVGVVERANAGNGLLYVKPQNGYELNELHDVLINGKTAGQVLRRNPSNTLWINDTLDTDDIGEGATNQYFTTARARSAFSDGNNITITNGVVSTVTEPDFTTVTVTEAPASGLYVTNKTYVDGAISSAISAINYPVDSVNGQTNTVVLDTDDISEGSTNLYYTNARADARVAIGIANLVDSAPATLDTLNELAAALGDDPNFATTVTTALGNKLNTADFNSNADTWLSGKSTTNVAEGTNLYYTTARARNSISGTGDISYDANTGVISYTGSGGGAVDSVNGQTGVVVLDTDDISEGTNLYYTNARARNAVANGTDIVDGGAGDVYVGSLRNDTRVLGQLEFTQDPTYTFPPAISNLVDGSNGITIASSNGTGKGYTAGIGLVHYHGDTTAGNQVAPAITIQAASGPNTAPTAIASGTVFGTMNFGGHSGSGFASNVATDNSGGGRTVLHPLQWQAYTTQAFSESTINLTSTSTVQSNVTVAGVVSSGNGVFTNTSADVRQYDVIRVTGTLTGTMTFPGYVSGNLYYVTAGANPTTTFTISDTQDGTPIATTAGTTTGLTFQRCRSIINFAAQTSSPFATSSLITAAGFTPSGYNGSFRCTFGTTTSVGYGNYHAGGAATVQGTVSVSTVTAVGSGYRIRAFPNSYTMNSANRINLLDHSAAAAIYRSDSHTWQGATNSFNYMSLNAAGATFNTSTLTLKDLTGANTYATIGAVSASFNRPVAYPSYTTTQRDALTPAAGWVLWNSTLTKLQVYTGTAWADLH